MNKKGSFLDVPIGLVLVFIFGTLMLTFSYVFNVMIDEGVYSAVPEAERLLESGQDAVHLTDNVIGFIVIGVLVAAVVTGIFVDTHPIFAIFSMFFFAGYVILGVVLANTFNIIINLNVFNPVSSNFSVTHLVIGNLPFFAVIGLGAWGVGFFVKSRFIAGGFR